MITLRFFLGICLLFSFLTSHAQARRFEFDNPNAMELTPDLIQLLTSTYWRVYRDDFVMKGEVVSTQKNISMAYGQDGELTYNAHNGTWTVIDGQLLDHRLHDREAEGRLNFGGLFAVIGLDASSLVLSKVLTTSNDMERTLYLRPSSTLSQWPQPNQLLTYYEGRLDDETLDSLALMDKEDLFDIGFNVLNGSINVITSDTIYKIPHMRRSDQK